MGYSNFDFNPNKNVDIYLYKLHGSIDWKRDPNNGNILIKQATPRTDAELIFGTDAKRTSIDPFCFMSLNLENSRFLTNANL